MKAKHLLTALVVPALLAACADDEFATNTQNKVDVDGTLVELGEDFAIGLTRGDDATTRANWHYEGTGDVLYSWLPTFDITEATAGTAAVENIGFAWRGEANDAKVRTNYKFTLDGFLKKGETAPKTIVCNGEVLVLNGYTFEKDNVTDEVKVTTVDSKATVNLMEYNDATKTMEVSSIYDITYSATSGYGVVGAKASTLPNALDADKLKEGDPYVRNGIFTTDNSTIFKGEYIVYFPYNPDFAEVNYLPATSPVIFTQDDANKNRVAHLAGKTFGYGKATITKGGSMAESFVTENLSSILDLKIKTESSSKNIQKIILVDEGEGANGFIKEVGLDASKIGVATGTGLYVAETEKYEPTLVLNLINSATAYAEVSTTAKEFTVATLPTKVKKLVAYLMDDKGLCCRKELATDKALNAGKASLYEIEIKNTDKFDQALAVDTKTFIEMLDEKGRGTTDATINVLGNITLDPATLVRIGDNHSGVTPTPLNKWFLQGNAASTPVTSGTSIYVKNNITVNGTGVITIPADLNILIKVAGKKTLTIKNPVVIEGHGCCGKEGGQLMLTSPANGEGTFVFANTVKNYGTMWLANNAVETSKTKIIFNSSLLNGVDEENEDAGEIYCLGLTESNSAIEMNGNVTNEGKIIVWSAVKRLGELDIWPFDTPGGEKYPDHAINSVQVTAKNIINDGAITVGKYTVLTTTANVTNNGEVLVEAAGTGESSEDGNWTIPAGSVANTGLVENSGVINIINDGTMANTSATAQIVDHVGSQMGGSFPKAEMGEYICDVDDEDVTADGDRLGYAMGPVIPTTTIRFIGEGNTKDNGNNGYVYNLNGYKEDNVLPYNFIIEATSKVKLSSTKNIDKIGLVAQPVSIKKLTVNSELNLSEIKLTATDVVTVNKALTVNPWGGEDVKTRETANAFIAEKDVNVGKNATFTVDKFVMTDLNANLNVGEGAKAVFDFATFTDVKDKITVNAKGTFTRKVATGGSSAIAAEVYCGSYDIANKGSVTDGYPVKR
ncbi:hypothetical protein [Bacteroides rodentium]